MTRKPRFDLILDRLNLALGRSKATLVEQETASHQPFCDIFKHMLPSLEKGMTSLLGCPVNLTIEESVNIGSRFYELPSIFSGELDGIVKLKVDYATYEVLLNYFSDHKDFINLKGSLLVDLANIVLGEVIVSIAKKLELEIIGSSVRAHEIEPYTEYLGSTIKSRSVVSSGFQLGIFDLVLPFYVEVALDSQSLERIEAKLLNQAA